MDRSRRSSTFKLCGETNGFEFGGEGKYLALLVQRLLSIKIATYDI